MSSKKVAVMIFASLAGVTLFLFQNCSSATQIALRANTVRADDLSDLLEKSTEEVDSNIPARREIAAEAILGERLERIIINDHEDVSKIQKRINDNKKKSAKN